MEFSPEHLKRSQYMSKLEVPPFSVIKSQLGEPLSEIMFETCPESLKAEMHLSRSLKGPGPDLWLSPSDLLNGKVILKPPHTNNHIKALTHQGILNFGQQLLSEWQEQKEKEKYRALGCQEELLMLMARREKEEAIIEALKMQDEYFRYKMAHVEEEFQETLKEKLQNLEASLNERYNAILEKKIKSLMAESEGISRRKIDEAVRNTVKDLSAKFLQDLKAQEAELSQLFNDKVLEERNNCQNLMNLQEEVCAKVLNNLKHTLQCNNIACLMYVLCLERRKCLHEQQQVVNCYVQRISELTKENKVKKEKVKRLKAANKECQRKLAIREDCLLGVMTQFQKFINFALKATPTQAEFLLSIEKMMTIEVAQALARTQAGKVRNLARKLMPWRPVSKLDLPKDLKMAHRKNYHNCLNEHPMPLCKEAESDEEQVAAEGLFSMKFQDRLYVREDFRNKVSQGLVKRTSDVLWSKDVENLVDLLKSTSELDVDDYEGEEEDDEGGESFQTGGGSYRSSVHFRKFSSVQEIIGLLATQDSIILQKSARSSFADPAVETNEKDLSITAPINLLGATDSLTLIKEKIISIVMNDEKFVSIVLNDEKAKKEPEQEAEPEREIVPGPLEDAIKLPVVNKKSAEGASQTVRTFSSDTIQLKKSKYDCKPNSSWSVDKKQSSKLISKVNLEPSTSGAGSLKKQYSKRKSRLLDVKDSLEMLKEKSNVLQEGNKLKNLMVPDEPVLNTDFPTLERIINVPDEISELPKVNFQVISHVFKEVTVPDTPWMIYNKTEAEELQKEKRQEQKQQKEKVGDKMESNVRENFKKKPNVAHIVGKSVEETINRNKDFTIHRIHSLVDILKKDSSLIRMFTKCAQ